MGEEEERDEGEGGGIDEVEVQRTKESKLPHQGRLVWLLGLAARCPSDRRWQVGNLSRATENCRRTGPTTNIRKPACGPVPNGLTVTAQSSATQQRPAGSIISSPLPPATAGTQVQ